MAALSLAVIGRDRQPLYMREFRNGTGKYRNQSEVALFGLPPPEEALASTVSGYECSTGHQFIFHSSLDRIDQLAGPPPGVRWRKPGVSGTDGMFVGLLFPIEEMRVYGYVTSTKATILLMVEDDVAPETQQHADLQIRSLLVKIHQLYIEDIMNPFKDISTSIISNRFNRGVEEHVAAYNQLDFGTI